MLRFIQRFQRGQDFIRTSTDHLSDCILQSLPVQKREMENESWNTHSCQGIQFLCGTQKSSVSSQKERAWHRLAEKPPLWAMQTKACSVNSMQSQTMAWHLQERGAGKTKRTSLGFKPIKSQLILLHQLIFIRHLCTPPPSLGSHEQLT